MDEHLTFKHRVEGVTQAKQKVELKSPEHVLHQFMCFLCDVYGMAPEKKQMKKALKDFYQMNDGW